MASQGGSVPSDTVGTSTTSRKRKAEASGSKDDRMINLATNLKKFLDDYQTTLSAMDKDLVIDLQNAAEMVTKETLNESILDILKFRFPVRVGDSTTQRRVNFVNTTLDDLSKLYEDRLTYANAIPAPSEYAKHSIWPEWQQKDTAILCFRPSDKQGLPLCVLDDVFRKFQQQVRIPLPSTEDARMAMNAAFNLCHVMPNNFAKESDRGKAFDKCLDPVLNHSLWRKEVHMSAPTEQHTRKADNTYEMDGAIRILREDKVEPGTGGDVYMQASRVYQLHVENVRDKKSALVGQGVPVFLLCLLGPMLLICGGFHDTKSTIVEPLVEPCLMFDDHLHVRQETLARQLFALKQGLDTLCSRSPPDGSAVNNPQAGVPRIYTTYITEDKAEQSLRFLRPLTERLPQPLLFVTSADKLVKLVVGNYGTEVHRLLAKHQFAPALYGQRCLESAPTAYVMEFLSPPTLKKSGWVTLFDFFKLRDEDLPTRYANAIRIALDHILDVMQDEKMVHGDLRPNNIMLEVIDSGNTPVCSDEKQGVKLRVVDFDWAGKSGEVCYPLQRNEDIIWPGHAGTPIYVEHDRHVVREWLSKRFPSMY